MKEKRERMIRFGFLLLCCAVLVVSTLTLMNRKEDWFIDEYYSYGCANNEAGRGLDFEDGRAYTPEELERMAAEAYGVTEEGRFRYDIVWNNLAGNVHPPLFYALLHTVCSLTPGGYSVWQGAAVNLLFALVCLYFFQLLARGLTKSEWTAGILTLAWTCCIGLYADVTLLRDYMAATCGVTASAWACFRYLRGKRGIPDLARIAAASAFAALSHYYCLIYLFFLCGVLCVILLARKAWRNLLGVVLAEGCAAAAAVAVFPAMVRRLLFSSRGAEAVENLADSSLSSLGERIAYFYREVNEHFFGGLLWALGILLVIAAAVRLVTARKRKAPPERGEASVTLSAAEGCLLILPGCAFFLLVSKIAAYLALRYMLPVTPVLFLSAAAALLLLLKRLPKERLLAGIAAGVMLVLGCLSWTAGSVDKLYIGRQEKIRSKLEPYQGTEAVVLWQNRNFMSVGLSQYRYFGAVTFYNDAPENMPEEIPVLKEGRRAVLLLGTDGYEDYLERLKELYPGYKVKSLGKLDGQNKFRDYLFVPK